jgi:hypothetical protein
MLTGLVTFCVKTAFFNGLLKERIEVTERGRRRRKKLLDDLKDIPDNDVYKYRLNIFPVLQPRCFPRSTRHNCQNCTYFLASSTVWPAFLILYYLYTRVLAVRNGTHFQAHDCGHLPSLVSYVVPESS